MVKRKVLKSLPAAVLLVAAMVCLLSSPAKYGRSILDGVSLWAICVLPATFPFLFLTALFTRLSLFESISERLSPFFSKTFKVSGAGGCAALLSAVSGYPVGARSVLDLFESGRIDENETFRLACLASTSGPMFLVGAVGSGMFSSPTLGWIMLACHFFGVWSVCFCMKFFGKAPKVSHGLFMKDGNALYDSLYHSVISILCVGGAIALFYSFSEMLLTVLPPLPPFGEGLVRGLMEMTAGCKAFSATPSPLSAAISCFLVTFGGMCVLTQQLAFLTPAGVKVLPFLVVKFIQGAVAGTLCFVLAGLVM